MVRVTFGSPYVTRPGWVEPEVYFRIVHATQNGPNGAYVAPYREQTVEIALGPTGAFENGNVGAPKRRMLVDKVVTAVQCPGDPAADDDCVTRNIVL